MTRINLVNPSELSDQHLIAEYRELPRIVNAVLNKKAQTQDIPEKFCFGKGHVKFFYNKLYYLAYRYEKIYKELCYRGFTLNASFSYRNMYEKIKNSNYKNDTDYKFNLYEQELSKAKLVDKYNNNPSVYKWTKRVKPEYYKNL